MKKRFFNIAIFFVLFVAYAYDYFFGPSIAEGVTYGALGLAGIDQNDADQCKSCDSGVARAIFIECEGIDLDATTWDPETGCVTGLALTGTGLAAEYVPDSDNTATLDFVGNRPTPKSFEVTVSGFLKFACLNKDKVAEANRLKKGCCFIIVVEYNDCNIMVAGLDIVENCSTDGELRFAKSKIVATPSLFGGNGSDESRLEVALAGTQRCFTALDQALQTYDDIKALAGL